jgi:hypothetical protein
MKIDGFVGFLRKKTDAIEVRGTYIDDHTFEKWWKCFADDFDFGNFDVGFE